MKILGADDPGGEIQEVWFDEADEWPFVLEMEKCEGVFVWKGKVIMLQRTLSGDVLETVADIGESPARQERAVWHEKPVYRERAAWQERTVMVCAKPTLVRSPYWQSEPSHWRSPAVPCEPARRRNPECRSEP